MKNLTEGKPARVLLMFALPMVISTIFQQLYSIADSVVAGNFINDDALAAVGASTPVTMLYTAIALGMNIGCSVVISHLFGAKDIVKTKTATYTSLITVGGVGLILSALGMVFGRSILSLLNTPPEIMGDSTAYFNIYTAGLTFIFIYNICTGAFTAMGDSKTPLVLLIISSVGNVILDLLFVLCFNMGVPGLAYATLSAQGFCGVLALFLILRRVSALKSAKADVFSFTLLKKISGISIPGICQHSFVSVGNLFVQSVVNDFGSNAIAGYSAAIKLNSLAINTLATASNALSSYTAQNIGARKLERVSQGYRACGIILICLLIPFTLMYTVFGEFCMRLFTGGDESAEVIKIGMGFLSIVSPFYIMGALKIASDGVLHGAASVKCFMATTFLDLLLRVAFVYILPRYFGIKGIWISWPIGWTISALLSYYFYKNNHWQKLSLHLTENTEVELEEI